MHFLAQRGVTLIEVLVAMLIFSMGLIGIAGLVVVAERANHAAYLRTQVTFLAQNMADRMRANPIGVWDGNYNGSYPDGSAQDCQGGCTPKQLAVHDRGAWSGELRTFLPARAKADITCSHRGLNYVPSSGQVALRPPYGGNCTMTIDWDEQAYQLAGIVASDRSLQTFAWEFQP